MAQSLLMYGVTGSFKTSNAVEYAYWLQSRYGGITRGLFGDNYGPALSAIRDGVIEAWDLTAEPDPLACIILASKGWWPEKLEDGRPQDVGKRKVPLIQNNFEGVSGYLIEGLHENAELFKRMLEAKKQDTGEPLVGIHSAKVYEQTVNYAMSSRGTYGFCQNQTHRYFKLGFKGLPVPWVCATSHEYANRKENIYGVGVAGKALAKTAPQWFDHTIHLVKSDQPVELVQGQKKVTVMRDGAIAYFDGHVIDAVKWPAKLGVEPWLKAEIYKQWPMGYVPLVMTGSGEGWAYTSSVRNLLEMIDPAPVEE